MASYIIGDVILDVGDGVVDSVVPSKKLVAKRHVLGVGAAAVLNVDERELARIGSAHIIKF